MDEIIGLILQEKMRNLSQSTAISRESSDSEQYSCPVCKDTRMISWKDEEGRLTTRFCECWPAYHAKKLLRESGLAEAVERQNFDTFATDFAFQREMKALGMRYVAELIERSGKHEPRNPWMYIGGNPGSGKTHICTAVCGELLKNNIDVKYMQWATEARDLKFAVNAEDFDDLVSGFTRPSVLYIDDLLKQKYADSPRFTDADIKIAFTILNARYLMNKPTIISSEWDLVNQLMDADEGVFSRVYERCKGFTIMIGRGKDFNYRMKGEAV